MTVDIMQSIKARDKLYVKWKKCKTSSMRYYQLENEFKSHRAILQKNIRIAKADYYCKQFENYKSDIKKTWNKINEIIKNKNKFPDLPKYFLDKEKMLTDDLEIAECFNHFFSQIGPSLAKSIKCPPNKIFKDYLKQNIT